MPHLWTPSQEGRPCTGALRLPLFKQFGERDGWRAKCIAACVSLPSFA